MADVRAPIGFPLSAFGPVGIFAGRDFGEVLMDRGPPPMLLLREPMGVGIALGDESRGASRETYGRCAGLGNEGETLGRSGPVGGGLLRAAGP